MTIIVPNHVKHSLIVRATVPVAVKRIAHAIVDRFSDCPVDTAMVTAAMLAEVDYPQMAWQIRRGSPARLAAVQYLMGLVHESGTR